ncbi:MAG: putative toxin-antitoxin system toxin component, PIN family [Bryobacteraceae bacterium]
MIRVVIDTNIVVSAMLRSGGLPEAVFNLAIDGRRVQMYFSTPVLAKYEDVLRRSRLGIHPGKVTHALAKIREAGLIVTPTVPATAASDPDDNIFLECAQAAETPVSGDRQLERLSQCLDDDADCDRAAIRGCHHRSVARAELRLC